MYGGIGLGFGFNGAAVACKRIVEVPSGIQEVKNPSKKHKVSG